MALSVVSISEKHLVHNIKKIMEQLKAPHYICCMLKSEAYGHGLIEIAQILLKNDMKIFGVARIQEAIKLREKLGDAFKILLFCPLEVYDLSLLQKYKVDPVVTSENDWKLLKNSPSFEKFHLQLDMGMNRLGVSLDLGKNIIKEAMSLTAQIKLESILTHLPDLRHQKSGLSDSAQMSFKSMELLREELVSKGTDIKFHMANSEALFSRSWPEGWGARPGISLYGVGSPDWKLEPLIEWTSTVVQIKMVKKGQAVSYGGKWVAQKDTPIAIIAAGYADGFPKSLSNKGLVGFKNEIYPVVGAVCMDYFMINMEGKIQLCVGDEVVLVSRNAIPALSCVEVSKRAGISAYEFLTGLGHRNELRVEPS